MFKRIFYKQNSFSGNFVNSGKRIWNSLSRFTLSYRQNAFTKGAKGTAGSNAKKEGGSLAKTHVKCYLLILTAGSRSDGGGLIWAPS